MVVKEVGNQLVHLLADLLILAQLGDLKWTEASKQAFWQLSEYLIVVVLANCKVDIVTIYHVWVQLAKDREVLPFLTISVGLCGFILKALPQWEELDHVFGGLFKDDQSIDAPGVKAEAAVSAQHKFGQEL